MNILRRLPLSRLLLLCGLVVAIGVSATALASALGGGPVPPAKPLADAVHDALGGAAPAGFSARVKLTNRLVEGAELASGSGQAGSVAQSPLLTGGSGRIWVSGDGHMRLELQAEKGDTQVIYDGSKVEIYDASTNTLYRYTPEGGSDTSSSDPADGAHESRQPPTMEQVEEGIAHVRDHANVSGATPTDVGGQPAYTVRVAPKEAGSLIGGAELSFDAVHGLPLRAAAYSSTGPDPVVELAASDVSYEPVDPSVFAFTPPAGAKVEDIKAPAYAAGAQPDSGAADAATRPKLTTHGHGVTGIAVLEHTTEGGAKGGEAGALEQLPKVKVNGAAASELRTALGTVLSFERGGVRYLVAGAVAPAAVEALARSL